MELCIKTLEKELSRMSGSASFNPCFNGTMYKNPHTRATHSSAVEVSILVLMELCIKTES